MDAHKQTAEARARVERMVDATLRLIAEGKVLLELIQTRKNPNLNGETN
jgi:hypothetical protein